MSPHNTKPTLRDIRLEKKRWVASTRFRAGLLVFVAVFFVSYIIETSSVSTKGFVISDLEGQVRTLQKETRALDVQIAKARSMDHVNARLADRGFVSAGQLQYLTTAGAAVALR